MAMSPAMESIFANAQQNAASLIETATLAINAKVNTIEEAEKMIQDLSSEAVKYNELLKDIANAMHQVESGDMSKEEAAGIIAPAVKELKDKCCALKIANVEAPGDDITEDEIAILRELIIGAKAAAEDRLVAIRLGDDDKVDPEIEAEVNIPDEDKAEESVEVAIEGKLGEALKKRKEDKNKINTLWNSFADKKSEAILSQFAKAAAPTLLAGADGKKVITDYINQMKSEDEKSGKDYSGKLTAKDYIVKTLNGVTMAIMPGNANGTGCAHIIAPIGNGKKGDKGYEPEVTYFFKKHICSAMLNPSKKEEAPAQESNINIENKNTESEEITMDFMSTCESAVTFTYVMEEFYDNLEVATESQSWQAVKGLLGAKSREARKAVKAGKKAAKAGDAAEAKKQFAAAKKLFGEQKDALQKLPKDMWDTISSWLNVGLLPLIYSFIGEGGYKDAPNKNVNVAAVINYLNRAMKHCDELAANVGKADKAEESITLESAMDELVASFGQAE